MKQVKKSESNIYLTLQKTPEDFCFIFNSMWVGNTPIGEDRKNVGLLIKAFYETFKNKKSKPALILKTTQVSASYMDRTEIIKRIKAIASTVNSKNLPNVYLFHGEISDEEMNELYNHPKVKAMVSLTKGEGWGRSLLEFSLTNKPIITTNWSGHTDYLNPEFTTLLPGQLTNVHPSTANGMLMKEAQWFSVDHGHVGHSLNDMFINYKHYVDKAKRQGFHSRTKFSFDAMKEKLDTILTNKVPEFPKRIELKLPELKKIELPSLKKIEFQHKKIETE
jgi:hypothetical protein